MPEALWSGHVLAVLWDFDDTMTPGYMQGPIFKAYGVNEGEFWGDVRRASAAYAEQGIETNIDSIYLLTFLSWVHDGRFPGLSIGKLTELGAELKFHKGLPRALGQMKKAIENDPTYDGLNITVEHYIISQGLRQMLLGTELVNYATKIYGSDFLEDLLPSPGAKQHKPNGQITQIANPFTSTDKTRALFEISKGTAVNPEIGVNDAMAPEDHRIPLDRMVYVADGPTDIPVWSILNKAGGATLAVYNKLSPGHRVRALGLEAQGRVKHVSAADFRPGEDAYEWIVVQLRGMADKILADVKLERERRVQKPGGHLSGTTVPKISSNRRLSAAHRAPKVKVVDGGMAKAAPQEKSIAS